MTGKPNRFVAPKRDWAALKLAYEQHAGDLASLAVAQNLTLNTLRRYAREKGWQRLPSSMAVISTPAPTLTALSRQLRHITMRQLQIMERRMSDDPKITPAEQERHSRTVGVLTRSMEAVDGINHSTVRRSLGKPVAAPEIAASEQDRLRRELAARIRKLRNRQGD